MFLMQTIAQDISKVKQKLDNPDRNVSQEFQIFGYELAQKLSDLAHKSLYIKLAKTEDRNLLNKALSLVEDYPNPQSKGKLFMYFMTKLKKEKNDRT